MDMFGQKTKKKKKNKEKKKHFFGKFGQEKNK